MTTEPNKTNEPMSYSEWTAKAIDDHELMERLRRQAVETDKHITDLLMEPYVQYRLDHYRASLRAAGVPGDEEVEGEASRWASSHFSGYSTRRHQKAEAFETGAFYMRDKLAPIIAAKDEQIAELKVAVAELHDAIRSALSLPGDAPFDREEYARRIEEWRKRLREAEYPADRSANEIEEYKAQLAAKDREIEAKDEEIDDLEKECIALRSEITRAKDALGLKNAPLSWPGEKEMEEARSAHQLSEFSKGIPTHNKDFTAGWNAALAAVGPVVNVCGEALEELQKLNKETPCYCQRFPAPRCVYCVLHEKAETALDALRSGVVVDGDAVTMPAKWLELAVHYLREMSEEYGGHVCNDIDKLLFQDWTQQEKDELMKSYHQWNGDPEEFSPGVFNLPDFALIHFLASTLAHSNEQFKNDKR